jgi:hypothetical protein
VHSISANPPWERNRAVSIMAKRKRKLTAAEKAEKKRRQKEYMTIFINGKERRSHLVASK